MASSSALRSGIKNYARYLNVLSGSSPYTAPVSNTFELLETSILNSNTTSVTFSNLNSTYGSTYQHLQLRIMARTDRADTDDFIVLRFNGDSGNNYTSHRIRGNGSNIQSEATRINYQNIEINSVTSSTQTAGSFGGVILDILDPFKTTKNTTIRAMTGLTGTYNYLSLNSGLWNSTAAVTTILLDQFFGSNFLTGSRFSLYGMRSS
jgi:hypothetical protein